MELSYENGYPTQDTVDKLYDEIDFQRACQAYLWGFPLVSAASVRRGLFQDIGATYNDFEMYPKYLDATGLWLTGNTTTIYSAAIIDLAKDGPVVVEVPAGPTAGMFGDYWFITTGVGALGPDKGHGGKFLLVPPGYQGELPKEGYFITPSKMNDTTFFIRGMVVNGDVAGAVALLKRARIYPYSERENPKPNRFFDVSDKPINTLEPEGLAFWELLSQVINNNPVQERDRFFMAMLKPLGIEKGKSFAPDERQQRILEEGACLGKAMAQTISFSPRLANAFYYPDKHWMNVMNFTLKQDSQQESKYHSELDERLNYFYLGTWPNEAMNLPVPSKGQRYLESFKDKDGVWLDGKKSYRLRVPADVPAKQFWSITVYDNGTRSLTQNSTGRAAITSYEKITARRPTKLVHNIVLSMPRPTPPDKVLTAARQFARQKFAQHRYAMVLHTHQQHPHVHLVVKAESDFGRRLHIDKQLLRDWREDFAQLMREQGIAANATPRAIRGKNKRNRGEGIFKAEFYQKSTAIRDRVIGIAKELSRSGAIEDPARERLLETRKSLVSTWMRAAEVLDEQGEETLAGDVRYFAQRLPPVLTDRQRLAAELIGFAKKRREIEQNGAERVRPKVLERTR